jgi:hypothetical protein
MAGPGERQQEIGRAYLHVLLGCLERSVRHFEALFDVLSTPDKLLFTGLSGEAFSFDAIGRFNHPLLLAEVFVESKGYAEGGGLYDQYKEFLAKAYSVSVSFNRHKRDLFWFVTNVPFAVSVGAKLTSPEVVETVLTAERNERVQRILGGAPIDKAQVRSLAKRLGVCIFTDSFIRWMGISYKARAGDTVWSITKLIHAGRVPTTTFNEVTALVGRLNNLQDVNKIRSGQRLHLPWYGMPRT